MEDNGYVSKVHLCRFKLVLSPVRRVTSPSCYGEGEEGCLPLQGEILCPATRQNFRGQRVPPMTPPAQNPPPAKVAYIGVSY